MELAVTPRGTYKTVALSSQPSLHFCSAALLLCFQLSQSLVSNVEFVRSGSTLLSKGLL